MGCFAQSISRIDSLLASLAEQQTPKNQLRTLSHLFYASLYKDPDCARSFAVEELRIATSSMDSIALGLAYYHLGVYHHSAGLVDSAMYYFKQSLQINASIRHEKGLILGRHASAILAYEQGNHNYALDLLRENIILLASPGQDISELATSYDLRGQVHHQQGKHSLAMSSYLEALALHKQFDKPHRKADILLHIADLEMDHRYYGQSLIYSREALEIYEGREDVYYQAETHKKIGKALFALGQVPESRHHLELAIVLAQEMGATDVLAAAKIILGRVQRAEGQFTASLKSLTEGHQLSEQDRSADYTLESLTEMALTYLAMQRPSAALPLLDRAVQIAQSIGAPEALRQAYLYRSETQERMGESRKALSDYRLYHALSDTLYNATKSQQIEELRTRLEIERNEQALLRQVQENELLRQRADLSALRLRSLWIGSVLILALGILAFLWHRQRSLRREVVQKLEKKALERDVEHYKRELTTRTLHIVSKNQLLAHLKRDIEQLEVEGETRQRFKPLVGAIDANMRNDGDWEQFEEIFLTVYQGFEEKIAQSFEGLTGHERRLICLMKMDLSTKEMAAILNITPDSVNKARYRLRKKLVIDTDESIQQVIHGL